MYAYDVLANFAREAFCHCRKIPSLIIVILGATSSVMLLIRLATSPRKSAQLRLGPELFRLQSHLRPQAGPPSQVVVRLPLEPLS